MRKVLGWLFVIALAACSGDGKSKTDVQLEPDSKAADITPEDIVGELVGDLAHEDTNPTDGEIVSTPDTIDLLTDVVPPDLTDAIDDTIEEPPPDGLEELVDLSPEVSDGQWEVDVEEGMSPYAGKVLINELLADGTTDEDANQDGSVDAMEDEFIELVVVGDEAVDMSGWIIADADWNIWLPRHTFPDGTILQPLDAVVVFGGGDPLDSTETVLYFGANAADPGIPYGLDFNDDGEEIRLFDAEGLLVESFTYGDEIPVASDQSLTRSPDLTGNWGPHLDADGADGAIFSPGTAVDGSNF
jgi:hypothetical protein